LIPFSIIPLIRMYLSSIFHRKTNGNFSIEKSYFSLPAIVCVLLKTTLAIFI
jgi:hypothetical protein